MKSITLLKPNSPAPFQVFSRISTSVNQSLQRKMSPGTRSVADLLLHVKVFIVYNIWDLQHSSRVMFSIFSNRKKMKCKKLTVVPKKYFPHITSREYQWSLWVSWIPRGSGGLKRSRRLEGVLSIPEGPKEFQESWNFASIFHHALNLCVFGLAK